MSRRDLFGLGEGKNSNRFIEQQLKALMHMKAQARVVYSIADDRTTKPNLDEYTVTKRADQIASKWRIYPDMALGHESVFNERVEKIALEYASRMGLQAPPKEFVKELLLNRDCDAFPVTTRADGFARQFATEFRLYNGNP